MQNWFTTRQGDHESREIHLPCLALDFSDRVDHYLGRTMILNVGMGVQPAVATVIITISAQGKRDGKGLAMQHRHMSNAINLFKVLQDRVRLMHTTDPYMGYISILNNRRLKVPCIFE